MSKQKTKTVKFISDGELIQKTVDADTAQFIATYKNVYHNIQNFDIAHRRIKAKRPGFIREAYQAESSRLKIICTCEYLPDVPEELDSVRYECGILNIKSNEFETVGGIVPSLYYKLFRGRVK